MQKSPFIVSLGDVVVRCLLVVAGLVFAVPVPSILLYAVATDLSTSRYYDDDTSFMWALVTLVLSAALYVAFAVPAIWRRRFFRSGTV